MGLWSDGGLCVYAQIGRSSNIPILFLQKSDEYKARLVQQKLSLLLAIHADSATLKDTQYTDSIANRVGVQRRGAAVFSISKL